MKKIINCRIYLLFIVAMYHTMYAQKALVIVPVADLIGSSIQHFYPHVSIEDGYKMLPLCGGNTNTYDSCPRVHQLLFNETVTILETRGQEVRVEIPHFFYITRLTNNPQCTYWMLKKNLVTFNQLEKQKIDLDKIPNTPSFKNKTINTGNTATLTMPFTDPTTKQTFSAGTRFVIAPMSDKQSSNIAAFAFDQKSKNLKKISIPRTIIIQQATTHAQQVKQFVDLLEQWANNKEGFIPYVWGGCSFTHTSNGTYCQKETMINNSKHSYFHLDDYTRSPKTGMDCANMIGRAAQLCDIPYYLKNSFTVASCLKPLQKDEKLECGDIIWINGHVMVVSNIEKNMMIEARSCLSDGQGQLQEIALNKAFKDISNYDQLIDICINKKPLYRIGKKGNVEKRIDSCKLFKLTSVWY